jgi:N-acetylmuramoyl-L-alanine amidase
VRVPLKTAVAILTLLIALTPRAQAPTPTRPPGRVIVIDPGHGGDDAGVRGRSGVLEKQITLETARRLRALLEMRLGARVILTRDEDTPIGLDARATLANSSRAELFVSLHFNAAPSSDAAGAVVYWLRLGREGEQVRRGAGRNALTIPAAGGGARTIEIVPWAFAQARHVGESARLASSVTGGLSSEPSLRSATALDAPLRVLSEVDAPAILVELAYLTNPAQEQLVASEEFQTTLAEALFTGVARFAQRREGAGGR